MTEPLAPPYPRAGQEGTPPPPRGVRVRRLAALVLAGIALALLLLVLSGWRTSYRVPFVQAWSGPILAVAVLAGLLALRGAARWVRAVLGVLGLVVALATWSITVGSGSEVVAEGTSADGSLVASLEFPQFAGVVDWTDGLVVRAERPGLVTRDLDGVCIWQTSGPPWASQVRWTGPTTFEIEAYGYGRPWRFEVRGDAVRPVGRSPFEPC